jgi:two-component system LytT family sensor kinase
MRYLKKFFRWHVLAWMAYFGYVVLGGLLAPETVGSNPRISLAQNVWLDASFQATRIATFYFCYLLLFPRQLRVGWRPLLKLGLGLLLAGVVFTGVRAALEEGLYPLLLGFQNYWPGTSLRTYLFDGYYYAIPNVALAAILWAFETALRRERENQQLTAEKRTAELAFLKTQLNPHFLYNTLNMLYGLAYGVDKTLAGGLLKLSELMRYMLRDTPDGLVELTEEVAYLENFLDLYHLRYPGRLYAGLTITGEPAGHRVAPLLLIPFVENAFKHGVLDDPATPVRMQLALTPEAVEFTVENQRHNYQADATSGIGLRNLRRRLELLYPGRFTCEAGPAGPQYRAHLRLAVPAAAGVPIAPAPLSTEMAALLAVVSAG